MSPLNIILGCFIKSKDMQKYEIYCYNYRCKHRATLRRVKDTENRVEDTRGGKAAGGSIRGVKGMLVSYSR